MNYFLSTKYKLGKVRVENNLISDGGSLFKSWEGHDVIEVIQFYKSKLNKTELRERRYLPKFIPIEEVTNADKRTTGTDNQTEGRPEEACGAV